MIEKPIKTCVKEKKKFECFMKDNSDDGKVQIWAICEGGTRYVETNLKGKYPYWQLCKYRYYSPKELGL